MARHTQKVAQDVRGLLAERPDLKSFLPHVEMVGYKAA